MDALSRHASEWLYRGVWAVLTDLFHVQRDPPHLPTPAHGSAQAFRPCDGWLRYRKLVFWFLLTIFDIALGGAWLVLFVKEGTVALWLLAPWLAVMILPDIIAYVAIYLRYDTTWYVLSDRSMRIRRGVWIITETTITFDNVQNVKVMQGPIQRLFGFSDLMVETAGGGGGGRHGHSGGGSHMGLLEGVKDPEAMRELIMTRVRASRTAGLGDEHHAQLRSEGPPGRRAWSAAHLLLLRRIEAATRVRPG